MPFDWKRATELNRDGLIDIVTRLFVLAGIRTGRSVAMLPRSLRIRILALLRPAEFAVRRLIVMAACGLEFTLRPSRARGAKTTNSVILGLEPRTHSVKPEPAADDRERNTVLHLRGVREVSGMGPRVKPEDDVRGETSRQTVDTARGEASPAFALFDPFRRFGHPWLEEGDDGEADWPALDPGEPVDARAVCRRIVALEAALQDVEGQARRLARWRARRHLEAARPRRWSVLRPGLPPGWRKRPKTLVEAVLKECHTLALIAWAGPDTS